MHHKLHFSLRLYEMNTFHNPSCVFDFSRFLFCSTGHLCVYIRSSYDMPYSVVFPFPVCSPVILLSYQAFLPLRSFPYRTMYSRTASYIKVLHNTFHQLNSIFYQLTLKGVRRHSPSTPIVLSRRRTMRICVEYDSQLERNRKPFCSYYSHRQEWKREGRGRQLEETAISREQPTERERAYTRWCLLFICFLFSPFMLFVMY